MNMRNAITQVVFWLYPLLSAPAFAQDCGSFQAEIQRIKENCDQKVFLLANRVGCYQTVTRKFDQYVSNELQVYLERQRTIISKDLRERIPLSRSQTNRPIRAEQAQKSWIEYRRFQCEMEDGEPKEQTNLDQEISYYQCLFRVDLSRFSELCRLNDHDESP